MNTPAAFLSSRRIQLLASAALLACSACSAEDSGSSSAPQDCAGGKCDDADSADENPCAAMIHDRAGRGGSAESLLASLGDPLASIVFDGDSCPSTFPDIVQKLTASGACRQHNTAMVSEDSQLLGRPGSFRAVTSMECEGASGASGTVWFSTFGIQSADPVEETPLPSNVEMIAFDPVEGVFNYYETEPDGVAFFGDSRELITQGAGANGERRCAGCHTGGGLIMKELAAPWLHWTPDFDSPGHLEIIDANRDLLGGESNGIILETQVDAGNALWNETRLAMLRGEVGNTTTVAQLLEPLFCTVEVNLESNASSSVISLPFDGAVTDGDLSDFTRVPISDAQYQAIIDANGQQMARGGNDTVGALTRIVRGRADIEYARNLITGGVIDVAFAEDVRVIDFTRSVFSEDRCGLLSFAPELGADDVGPDAIRDGFVANLQAANPAEGTPAADFLVRLQDKALTAKGIARSFEQVCAARSEETTVGGVSVPAVVADYMTYITHVRGLADDLQVFEFRGQTMPTASLNTPSGTRLHPVTCELTTEYASPGGVNPDTDDAFGDDCIDRCGEFDPSFSCQCDPECEAFGTCCDDFEEECVAAPAGSCEGRCGTVDESATCQCDDSCEGAGDCCADREAVCG